MHEDSIPSRPFGHDQVLYLLLPVRQLVRLQLETCLSHEYDDGEVFARACSETRSRCAGIAHSQPLRAHQSNILRFSSSTFAFSQQCDAVSFLPTCISRLVLLSDLRGPCFYGLHHRRSRYTRRGKFATPSSKRNAAIL